MYQHPAVVEQLREQEQEESNIILLACVLRQKLVPVDTAASSYIAQSSVEVE